MPEESTISREFTRPWAAFEASVSALRKLHEVLAPHVVALDEQDLFEALGPRASELTPSDRKELAQLLLSILKPLVPGEDPANVREFSDDDLERLIERMGPRAGLATDLVNSLSRKIVGPRHANLLRGSLLAAAISAFEVLVGALVRGYYLVRPAALGEEPKFSLRDLERFENLTDAREEAIAIRVQHLLHGDLEDWGGWMEKNPGLHIKNLALKYGVLSEVFQRRHVIVHNSGFVSRLYLQRVQFDGDPPAIGTPLEVDNEYLERALDELQTLGVLLASGVWSKCSSEDEPGAIDRVHTSGYQLLRSGRWEAARKVAEVGQLCRGTEEARTMMKVNAWIARRAVGETEEVRREVQSWDTSALQEKYVFARVVLLGEWKEAFQMAERLLESEEIRPASLVDWPLLQEFRSQPEFDELMRRLATSDAGDEH